MLDIKHKGELREGKSVESYSRKQSIRCWESGLSSNGNGTEWTIIWGVSKQTSTGFRKLSKSHG